MLLPGNQDLMLPVKDINDWPFFPGQTMFLKTYYVQINVYFTQF